MTEKLKIAGVGIDTTTIGFNPGDIYARESSNIGYIYTSIEANNDFLLKTYIQSFKTGPVLVVGAKYLNGLALGLKQHLNTLERAFTQLLLVDESADWKNWVSELSTIKAAGTAQNFGLQIGSGADLEKVKEIFELAKGSGTELNFIALPVCPLDFNYEVLSWAKENKVTVFGFNPFGGNLSAARNIQTFSIPYLLGFAAGNADIVVLSGRDMQKAYENADWLTDIIGKESKPEYTLKKSVCRPVKELKKAIYTSIKVDPKTIIPYEAPDFALPAEFITQKIGSYVEQYIEPVDLIPNIESTGDIDKRGEESLEDSVQHLIKILYYPEDGKPEDYFAIARYKAIEYLNLHFPGAEITFSKTGNTLFWINVHIEATTQGHWWWLKVVPEVDRTFWLAMPQDGKDHIIFREAKAENAESEK